MMGTKSLRQKAFDIITKHLLKQGRRSTGPGGVCMYRGSGGLQCAVGCLIPDIMYTERLEGALLYGPLIEVLRDAGWGPLVVEQECYSLLAASDSLNSARSVISKAGSDGTTLWALQGIHDGTPPEEWRRNLRAYAKVNGLKWPRCRPSEGYIK